MNSIPLVDIAREKYRGRFPAGFFSLAAGGDAAGDYEKCTMHLESAPHDEEPAGCDLYGRNKWSDVVNANSWFDLGVVED